MLAHALTSLIAALATLVVRIVLLPFQAVRWLAFEGGVSAIKRWCAANHTESWGFLWWGCVGLAIAIPELWASVAGETLEWPTISGTTAHLEVAHQWVAFIVIALLAWAALQVIRVAAKKMALASAEVAAEATSPAVPGTEESPAAIAVEQRALATSSTFMERGRTTVHTGDPQPMKHPLWYFVFAIAIVALPALAFQAWYDVNAEDHRYVVGYVIYASIGFWWIALPSWAVWKEGWLVPFPSMFQTFKDIERHAPVFTTIVAAGLLILTIHLVLYPWPATIPDTNRLHTTYMCHPLTAPKKPLTAHQKEACEKLKNANISPEADSP